jgi:hypothetical protein
MIRSLPAACLLFLLLLVPARSQDSIDLKIKEIDISNFPVVLMKLDIRRNGTLIKKFSESNFTVFENKVGQRVESIVCPGDSNTRLSTAILLDRSGSMRMYPSSTTTDPDSGKIRAAKQATRVFVEFLEDRDEACIYSFASDSPFQGYVFFRADQPFTRDTAALKRALIPIVGDGGTWIWRALLRTIDSLKNRAGRPAMIVLTDGRSQGEEPQYTYQQVITKAQQYKIPVYIIGLGTDVDETKLRSICSSTGGKYYRSPTASMLEQIFRSLAAEIITDACMLRYTSTNPCLDGSSRLVEVEVHAPGNVYDEDSATFTVPRSLSPVTLSVGVSQEIGSHTSFRVPILIQEFLTVNSPMTWALTVVYDPSVAEFDSVVTDGTVSQGSAVNVARLGPGSVRLSLVNQLPAMATGSLVELAFTTRGTPDSIATAFRLRDAALSQQCPTEVTTNDAFATVLPCEAVYLIGNSETFIVKAGSTLRFPVRILPGVPATTQYVLNLVVRYSETDLEYAGFDSIGTLATRGSLTVTKAKDLISLTLRGTAGDSTDRIVDLLFTARPRTTSAVTHIDVFGSDMRTDCRVIAQSAVPTVLIDGECERILARAPTAQSITNHPNPFSRAGGAQANGASTQIRFSVTEDRSFVRITVHDATGREVATPVAATFDRGVYACDFHAAHLPAGTYFAILSTPQGRTLHPMLLLR